MAKIINLRGAKKARVRAEIRAKADENAVKFGRTVGQKRREAQDAARAQSALDGHERGQT